MRCFLLVIGFIFVAPAFLAGCHSLQFNKFAGKTPGNALENSVIDDLHDGRLDVSLDRACLIASGVNTDKRLQAYLEKIDLLISRIDRGTDVNNINDPLTKARTIFGWLRNNASEGTYNDCYDIRDTLNLQVGNCLSYAIRFTIICRHCGIDIQNVFIPGHIYNALTSNGKTEYFEHTHSDGIVKSADMDSPGRKVMKDEELIAEIFLYKARNANNDLHYDESIKYCQWASKCNPDDSRPVILLMDNYIAKKKYEDAYLCLHDYISRHPDDKNSFKKTYKLLQRLCKKGDNAEQK